jgi:ubiquinone/menaquinone biosynthesis C-methylase UbiE
VRAGYDRIAERYLAARTTGEDIAALRELISRLRRGDRVLDAGCGAGDPISRRLVAAGFDVVGLDFSRAQLGLARSGVQGLHLAQGDLVALPFAATSFSAVVSYYAVIHVPRSLHAAVFAEAHRVLRRRGLALLCLGFGDVREDHDEESWLGVPMYWSHFDGDTNLALLGAVGFDILWHAAVADPMGHGRHLFVLCRA